MGSAALVPRLFITRRLCRPRMAALAALNALPCVGSVRAGAWMLRERDGLLRQAVR